MQYSWQDSDSSDEFRFVLSKDPQRMIFTNRQKDFDLFKFLGNIICEKRKNSERCPSVHNQSQILIYWKLEIILHTLTTYQNLFHTLSKKKNSNSRLYFFFSIFFPVYIGFHLACHCGLRVRSRIRTYRMIGVYGFGVSN